MPDTAPVSAEALYRGLVVERARRPLHAGAIAAPDGTGAGTNPLCGDTVRVDLRCDVSGRLAEVRHRTEGCAICAAASDLMADSVTGLDRAAVGAMWRQFDGLLRDGAANTVQADRDALGLLNAFADLHEYRSRRKCATLPWSALLAAMEAGGGP